MLAGRAIAMVTVLGADAVPVLRDFARDPALVRKRRKDVAHQLGLPDTAGVAANDDQSPAPGGVVFICPQLWPRAL